MKPFGKPKKGFEVRFAEIFNLLEGVEKTKPGFWDTLFKKRVEVDRKALLKEWFEIQTPAYETIKAAKVGRDKAADDWLKEQYGKSDKQVSEADFFKGYEGYYVVELAEEEDGVPVYSNGGLSDEVERNAFRGQFLDDCYELLGENLVVEAWGSKLAEDALDYGNRLMAVADRVAREKGLEHLKNLRTLPGDFDDDETSIENQLHITFSLAKWLIFYGKNGHGYEADF